MADRGAGFEFNADAIRAILTSDAAHDVVLARANRVCDEVNRWADGFPRSGDHPRDRGPHFEVRSQPSVNRARYVVVPRTGFGHWLTRKRPLEFQALLESGRG